MKNNLPLERQVCTKDQAREFFERLGVDAPESLWTGVDYTSYIELPGYDINTPRLCCDLILSVEIKSFKKQDNIEIHKTYPAYTGDELGALLKKSAKWKDYPCYFDAKQKAALAIEGLREGWIKPEEFRYA